MTPQENCSHAKLQFGDGDYQLTCQDCGARWAMISPTDSQGEFISPESANQGVGAQLTGRFRVAPGDGA